jgi:hypothetical protein
MPPIHTIAIGEDVIFAIEQTVHVEVHVAVVITGVCGDVVLIEMPRNLFAIRGDVDLDSDVIGAHILADGTGLA